MEIINQILSLYAQIDQRVAEFQLKTGLRCPPGCGTCCPTADVQTTVLEMLPAAHDILSRGIIDQWVERISVQAPQNLCVFYQIERKPNDPGHCSIYPLRPSICRLFGFSSVHTRSGPPVLAVCGHLKRLGGQAVAQALACQDEAPVFSDMATQLYSLEPSGKFDIMPINQALSSALMRLGLSFQLAAVESSLGQDSAA